MVKSPEHTFTLDFKSDPQKMCEITIPSFSTQIEKIEIKGQLISKAIYSLLNSPKNLSYTILSAFRSFFGRIEETIICFQD